MKEIKPLDKDALCWRCEPAQFDFETTAQLQDLDEILGQPRALDAVQFGMGIRRQGYNLYALGPPGIGKRTLVRQFVGKNAAKQATPSDWCYVHNFKESHKPKALRLPCGRGSQLRDDMDTLIEDLRAAIQGALAMDEHRHRVQEIEQEAKDAHESALEEIAKKAESQGLRLVRTPGGFAIAPVRDGEILSPEDFSKLSEEEQKRIEGAVNELQSDLRKLIEKVPQRRKETRDKTKALHREAASAAIEQLLTPLRKRYSDLPQVLEYFDAVEHDVLDHLDDFQAGEEETPTVLGMPIPKRPAFQRYKVNLLVDNGQCKGAPVIEEDHPTFANLMGRPEHETQMGTLVTDFTLLKPGALHRANGGYLVVDVLRLLQQPFAWDALKRALQAGRIKIEPFGNALGLLSTVSLEPEPISLDVKVVLMGNRLIYYLLSAFDPDFGELFKIAADFEDRMDRSEESCRLYARLLATLARRDKHRPLDRGGVARVIEHSARVADDSEKLSTHMRVVSDLIQEADHWAAEDNAEAIQQEHIDKAIDKQIYRADRIRERIQEEIRRGTILIDTDGEKTGQVNGLSVLSLGNFVFGQPSRITATARLGKGEVIDIQREVELGGPIHSKGVLILSSFLAARYAKDRPLSLSASLVFEQSYGMVDGDSASLAETCALLSSLAEAPVKQSLAITGSVNQHGQVQPIGGVNQKIEGFFDVCSDRGLTGTQGVLIPAANVKHLMLRKNVVDAAEAGKFHIYAVETVDEAASLLTGISAGELDDKGEYPPDTLNYRVQKRLTELSQSRRKFVEEAKLESPNE